MEETINPEFEDEEVVVMEETRRIIVYNDDYNTFGHVIQCLIRYCGHNPIQAEQCAWIIHTAGKHQVKSGTFEDLVPIKQALNEKGIDAKIE